MNRIAICGITGSQGGAVADVCLENNLDIIGITRNTDSEKAKYYAEKGVHIVEGDFDNSASLLGKIDNCQAIFIVTNFWEHMDPEREFSQGKNIIDAAIASGVKHIIWSTLEDTNDFQDSIPRIGDYKVPHFDEKGKLSKYLETKMIGQTHLYTSFFYENLLGMMKLNKEADGVRRLCMPMSNVPLPIITVKDIGKMVYHVFENYIQGHIGVASEHLTGSEMATILSDVLEEPVEYIAVSPEQYRQFGFPGCQDLANMFEFKVVHNDKFCKIRNMVDVKSCFEPTSFKQWCIENKDKL
jgi:uncharacterized protein YbjT (DUF2867 family)